MSVFREIALTIANNSLRLPIGLKILATAFVLVFGLDAVGVDATTAWSIALLVVIPTACGLKLANKGR